MNFAMGPWLPKRSTAKKLGARTYFTGKICKNCHVSYRFTASGHCSECDKDWDKKRADKAHRKEASKVSSRNSQRRRRASDPDYVARERAYDKERKLLPEVREGARQLMRIKRLDPEYVARERQYKRDHPEQVASQNHKRRARLNESEGSHTASDIMRIFMHQGKKCAECFEIVTKSTWHVDHIMPLSKGGSNWPSNLQILCRRCNLEKHASDPIDFARRKGRLI